MVVVAVVGISGVGKSTALKRAALRVEFQHLMAGQLIKDELTATSENIKNIDQLRFGEVTGNQTRLISGFKRQVSNQRLIVLDGHTVIDDGKQLTPISARVFDSIGIHSMIFLEASPGAIRNRRLHDTERSRPILSLEAIVAHQETALDVAKDICARLNITLHRIDVDDLDLLSSTLASHFQSAEK